MTTGCNAPGSQGRHPVPETGGRCPCGAIILRPAPPRPAR